MKKNISLNVVEEIVGKRDSMLSEKRTTRAMLRAPSSRTTVRGSERVNVDSEAMREGTTYTFRR